MKKSTTLIIAVALVFTFALSACSSGNDSDSDNTQNSTNTTGVSESSVNNTSTPSPANGSIVSAGTIEPQNPAVTIVEIVPLGQYREVGTFYDGRAVVVSHDSKYGLIDTDGNEVAPPKYDEITTSYRHGYTLYNEDGFIQVKLDGKDGLIDKDGREIAPPGKYFVIPTFTEGFAAVRVFDDTSGVEKWGFIDTQGQELVPPKYDEARDFSDGMAAVISDDEKGFPKLGYINTQGDEVIPLIYDGSRMSDNLIMVEGGNFKEGLAVVNTFENSTLIIDKTGAIVATLEHNYKAFKDFSEGLVAVKRAFWGYADTSGREVIPQKYGYVADPFTNGLAHVNAGWVITKTGQEIGYGESSNDWKLSEGMAVLYSDRVYNNDGDEVVPRGRYAQIFEYAEGMAAVIRDGKYGFINKLGEEVIECKYDLVSSFSDDRAMAVLNGKTGLIGLDGTEVIPCRYDSAGISEYGLVAVTLNGKAGIVKTDGSEVIPCEYSYIGEVSDDLVTVLDSNNEYGVFNLSGNMVIPFGKYELSRHTKFSDGFAIAVADREDCVIDIAGNIVVPPGAYSQVQGIDDGLIRVFNQDVGVGLIKVVYN